METLVQDIRFAIRGLRGSPGFALVAVLTLGLWIGANAAMFSVVNAFLFRPLPVADPGRLAVIATRSHQLEFPLGISYPNYRDYREHSSVFSDIVIYSPAAVSINFEDTAQRSLIEVVSGNYFDMLGIAPALGRNFVAEEQETPGGAPVVVLDYAFWQRQFGGVASVIGRTIKINEQAFTVVGIAPESFRGTEFLFRPDAYIAAAMAPYAYPTYEQVLEERRGLTFRAMGRLLPGVTTTQAEEAMNVLAAELEARYPVDNKGLRLLVVAERLARPEPSMTGLLPPVAAIFMALLGMILLIACANVAGLLLVRASARNREIAIRAALGAGRLRLFRQLITDGALLGLLGGIAGWIISIWAVGWLTRLLNSWSVQGFNLRFELAPDWRVLLFAALISLIAGLVAGAVPAHRLSRGVLFEALKDGGRGAGNSRHRLRNALVVGQVAVSLVLLIVAGLFVRSLDRARQIDLGFSAENRLLLSVDPSLVGYEEERAQLFYQELLRRVRALPGVRSASLGSTIAFGGNTRMTEIAVDDTPGAADEQQPLAVYNLVGDGYFQAAGTRVLRGRTFNRGDDASAMAVAIVSETMAEMLWPDQDPLGRQMRAEGGAGRPIEVVGVVQDSKVFLLREDPRPIVYVAAAQEYAAPMTLFVHTASEPASLVAPIREQVRAVDPNMLVYGVTSMRDHLENGTAFLIIRVAALAVGTFGLLGWLLAAIGLYGVISYTVSQRTHEIGVRMALGARSGDVLGLILGQGGLLVGIGLGIGLLAGLMLTRFAADLLVGVAATDPITFAAVSLFLTAVALLATFLPAQRATGVDPLVALREY